MHAIPKEGPDLSTRSKVFQEHEGSVLTVLGMWWSMTLWTGIGIILKTLGARSLGTTTQSVVLELECAPSFTDLKQ